MAFSLPNPTSPTNGQSLDATPILANEVALANALASFDGSQIQNGTVPSSAFATTANPNTLLSAISVPFVQSGVVWTTVSGLAGTMSGGTIYYNGTPVTVNSIASHTFTASEDTYIDVDKSGNVAYSGVSNGSSSPSLTANSIRVAKVITSGSAITSVVLNGSDTLGNIIYPVGGLTPALMQNPCKFSVYRNASLSQAQNTIIVFDTKIYDSGANYSVSTGLFTAPETGVYKFDACVQYTSGNFVFALGLQKNGSGQLITGPFTDINVTTNFALNASFPLLQLSEGDTIGVFWGSSVSNTTIAVGTAPITTWFGGSLESAT